MAHCREVGCHGAAPFGAGPARRGRPRARAQAQQKARTSASPARRTSSPPARTVKVRQTSSQRGGRRRGGGQGDTEPKRARGSAAYFNVTGFPFPLGPVFSRPTVRIELERGRVWLFEQEQALAFSNVVTNIRMTVIRLRSGGLWVHAPIAPTQECVRLVEELGCPVEHIILPTFAYEHKVFVGPFSRRFPSAQVHVAPRQWSWPIPLPPQAVGIFPTSTLRDDDEGTPWAAEIKQKVFAASVGFGPYSEVAFFDVRSKTLIVTDAVIQVPSQPPEVIPERALQNSGRRVPFPISAVCRGKNARPPPAPEDPAERRVLGWMRMTLLVLYFTPADLLTPEASFAAVADRLCVSPVVRTLVFTKASRAEVRAWVGAICADWAFARVIPAHFAAPVPATPADLREAFSFLFDAAEAPPPPPAKPAGLLAGLGGLFRRAAGAPPPRVATEFPYNDMRGLRAIESVLQKANVINKG